MLKLRRSRQRRFWRRAGFWALLLVVILLVMGISDRGSRQLNFLQRPVFAAMTTVGGVVGHLRNKLRNLFAGGYSREISRLNRSLEQLKIAAAANLEQQQELSSLRKLFSLVSPLHYQLKGARVIRLELRGAHHLMVINRGSRDQVSRGMIVLAGDGLVGRVEQVGNNYSTIMLLTDPNHAVDVLVQRSRVRGIMLGTGGDDLRLRSGSTIGRLEYVRGVVDVVVGDVLVTSGLDGRYPAGIPVGELTKVRRTTEGTLDYAEVVPFVDWNAIQLVSLVRVEGDL